MAPEAFGNSTVTVYKCICICIVYETGPSATSCLALPVVLTVDVAWQFWEMSLVNVLYLASTKFKKMAEQWPSSIWNVVKGWKLFLGPCWWAIEYYKNVFL